MKSYDSTNFVFVSAPATHRQQQGQQDSRTQKEKEKKNSKERCVVKIQFEMSL